VKIRANRAKRIFARRANGVERVMFDEFFRSNAELWPLHVSLIRDDECFARLFKVAETEGWVRRNGNVYELNKENE
jgi:hypothetical protein